MDYGYDTHLAACCSNGKGAIPSRADKATEATKGRNKGTRPDKMAKLSNEHASKTRRDKARQRTQKPKSSGDEHTKQQKQQKGETEAKGRDQTSRQSSATNTQAGETRSKQSTATDAKAKHYSAAGNRHRKPLSKRWMQHKYLPWCSYTPPCEQVLMKPGVGQYTSGHMRNIERGKQ